MNVMPVYNKIRSINDQDIETIYRVARTTYLIGSHKEPIPKFNLLTDNWADMPDGTHSMLTSNKNVGLCFSDIADEPYFNIWLHPNFFDSIEGPKLTFMHELSHGLIGNQSQHNFLWRRFFVRVAYHYIVDVAYLMTPEKVEKSLFGATKRYSPVSHMHRLEISSSVKCASQETDVFLEEYFQLLSKEVVN